VFGGKKDINSFQSKKYRLVECNVVDGGNACILFAGFNIFIEEFSPLNLSTITISWCID
jgi:hypothetical protein